MKNLARAVTAAGTVLGSLAAAPGAHAHATYNVAGYSGGITDSLNKSGTTSGSEVWVNGTPSEWLSPTSTLPSIGYLGMHGNNSTRAIETGNYCGATAGGADCIGAANTNANSLLRQVYNYNHAATPPATPLLNDYSLAVAGNSWAGGISTSNTGLDWGNIHASAGSTGNLESNLIATGANYLNITLADDTSDGLPYQQLAFSVYGGWDRGGGLSDLTLLSTQTASTAGGSAGVSLQLFGHLWNGHAGEYTVAVGDQSSAGGQYRLTLNTSSAALYSSAVVQAVPIPAAVWLFGSALAGMGIIGRRRQGAAA